jgi:hypothetical protein
MAAPGSMPWSLKGVSREARRAAKSAAREAGLPIGAWLSRAIRATAAAEGVTVTTTAARDSLIERAMARIEADMTAAGRAED